MFRKCFTELKGMFRAIYSLIKCLFSAYYATDTVQSTIGHITEQSRQKIPCPPKSLPSSERRQAISKTPVKCNQHPHPNLIGEGSGIQGGEGLSQESQR